MLQMTLIVMCQKSWFIELILVTFFEKVLPQEVDKCGLSKDLCHSTHNSVHTFTVNTVIHTGYPYVDSEILAPGIGTA